MLPRGGGKPTQSLMWPPSQGKKVTTGGGGGNRERTLYTNIKDVIASLGFQRLTHDDCTIFQIEGAMQRCFVAIVTNTASFRE